MVLIVIIKMIVKEKNLQLQLHVPSMIHHMYQMKMYALAIFFTSYFQLTKLNYGYHYPYFTHKTSNDQQKRAPACYLITPC